MIFKNENITKYEPEFRMKHGTFWDNIKFFTGFQHVSYLQHLSTLTNEQLEICKKLTPVLTTNLTTFRHHLVRLVTISENFNGYITKLQEKRTDLDEDTDRLPFIVRQIAQLFQTIVLWCAGYDQYIKELRGNVTLCSNEVSDMCKNGVCVGQLTPSGIEPYDIVAKPEFDYGYRLFTGGVKFCFMRGKTEAGSVTLAKTSDPRSRAHTSTEISFNPKKYHLVNPSDIALQVTNFVTPQRAPSGISIIHIRDFVLQILSRGEESRLYCYEENWVGDEVSSKFTAESSDRIATFNQAQGPIMPRFWTTDMSQFTQKPASLGGDMKALLFDS